MQGMGKALPCHDSNMRAREVWYIILPISAGIAQGWLHSVHPKNYVHHTNFTRLLGFVTTQFCQYSSGGQSYSCTMSVKQFWYLNWRPGLPALLGGNLGCWISNHHHPHPHPTPYIAQFLGYVMGRIHMTLRSYSVLDILLPPIIIIMQECSQTLKTYKRLQIL